MLQSERVPEWAVRPDEKQQGVTQQAPPAASVPACEIDIYNPAATATSVLLAPGMFSNHESADAFSRDTNSDVCVNAVYQRLYDEQVGVTCDEFW
jgi:hypothetical protein